MSDTLYVLAKDSPFSLIIGKINQHWFCGLVTYIDTKPLLLMAFGKYFAKKIDYPYFKFLFQKIPSVVRTEYFFNHICHYEAYDLTIQQVQLFFGVLKGYAETHDQILSGWLPHFTHNCIELQYCKNLVNSAIKPIQHPGLLQSFSEIYWGNTCRESILHLAEYLLKQPLNINDHPRFGEFKLNINYQFHHLTTLDNIPRNSLILRHHPEFKNTSQVFYKYRRQARWLFDCKEDEDNVIHSLFKTPFDTADASKLAILDNKLAIQSNHIYSLPPKTGVAILDKIYQRLLAIACSEKTNELNFKKFECLKTFYLALQEKKRTAQDENASFSKHFAQIHQHILFKHREPSLFNYLFKTKTQQLFEELHGKPSIIYAFLTWLYQKITALYHQLNFFWEATPNTGP